MGEHDTLTATSSSGLPVTFGQGTSPNGACSVDGTTVTYLHAQECTVTLSQAGNDDYDAVDTTGHFSIGRGTPTITLGALDPAPRVGGTDALSATSASDGGFTFSRGDGTTNNACAVTPDGGLTFQHVGTCVVRVQQAETADYRSATATTSFGIGQGVSRLQLTLPSTGKVDGSDPLAVTSDSDGKITYSLGQGNACTLDDARTKVLYRHVGTCTVTASQAGTTDYPAATSSQQVTVGKGAQQIRFTSTPPSAPALHSTYDVSATGGSSGKRVTFSSATPALCRVTNSDQNPGHATVTFDHAGDCVVNADQEGSADYDPAPRVTQKVTVPKASQQITFTSTPPSPAVVGTTYAVKATGGASGNDVTFGSSTPKTCSVAGSTVTFLAAGPCTVTADQLGSADYDPAPTKTQDVPVSLKSDLSISARSCRGTSSGVTATGTA